jgi:diamine N-acetyltransferase
MISLSEINADNYKSILRLKVNENQKSFVAPNSVILAKAYAYGLEGGTALGIFEDGNAVGLISYRLWEDSCILDQFMIDERFQGKGYGKETLSTFIEDRKKESKYNKILLCCIEGDMAAEALYKSFGFVIIDRDEAEDEPAEIIMERLLQI